VSALVDRSRMNRMCRWAVLASTLSCGGPPPPKTALQAELEGLPKWALGNCREYLADRTMLCGSGSVQGVSNLGLARSAAETQARAELARTLQVRVKSMLRDYQAATLAGAATDSTSEQHIEDVSRQITDLTLVGTRVEATFIADTGTFWALVVLDPHAFKSALNDERIDEATRRTVLGRADRSFSELDAATVP